MKSTHHKLIFDNVPIAIVIADYSAVAKLGQNLKKKKVPVIREYLADNLSGVVLDTIKKIKFLDVNKAALDLYGLSSKQKLIKNLYQSFAEMDLDVLVDHFASLCEGNTLFVGEFRSKTFLGKSCDVLLHVSVPADSKRTLKNVIITLQDITIRKRLERHLIKRAQLDGLTKLLNHNAIYRRLEEEVFRAQRYGLSLSLMMIDLDYFKGINDRYGHQRGDQILKQVAVILEKSLRKVDVIGRYGGDEFLVILPETTPVNAEIAAARIQQVFSVKTFRVAKSVTMPLTVSIGICGFPSAGIKEARDVVAKVDKAMYAAKKQGRDRIVIL